MKKESVVTQCQFWDPRKKCCQLSENGLFVPFHEHITTYCQTANHTSCAQYLNNKSVTDDRDLVRQNSNRRLYDRVEGRYSFRISEFDRKYFAIERVVDETAVSVDFGIGGIRFETRRQFLPESLLRFSLNADFSHEDLYGFGKVQWCMATDKSDFYHAGISFINAEESTQLKRQLLQVHE